MRATGGHTHVALARIAGLPRSTPSLAVDTYIPSFVACMCPWLTSDPSLPGRLPPSMAVFTAKACVRDSLAFARRHRIAKISAGLTNDRRKQTERAYAATRTGSGAELKTAFDRDDQFPLRSGA